MLMEEKENKLSVVFSFPNEPIDPETINRRAYNCLIRKKICDTDTLLEQYSSINNANIKGLGEGTKQLINDYLVDRQVEHLSSTHKISREDAEIMFLMSLCKTNDPRF